MKITRQQLKNLIIESLEADEEIEVDDADLEKIKDLIMTLENENIKHAAALCDALGIDFQALASQVVENMFERGDRADQLADAISMYVDDIGTIVYGLIGLSLSPYDERSKLYLDSENAHIDLSMEFHYGVVNAIKRELINYFTQLIVAVGNE